MKKWQSFGEKVTVLIKDKRAHLFITSLKAENVYVTEMKVTDDGLQFKTTFKDLNKIRKIRNKYSMKVEIFPRTMDHIFRWNMATFFGIGLWILIPYISSFFVWSVVVEADTPEREDEIIALLDKSGVKQLTLIKRLPDEALIRQKVMKNDSELSWVNISRSGGKYTLTPLPAPIHTKNEKSNSKPAHLIAAKSGIITHVSISKGERVVKKDSTVRKGDVLVSAFIKQGDEFKIVGAEGSVFADYWLETDFAVPKTVKLARPSEKELRLQWLMLKDQGKSAEYWKEYELPSPLNKLVKAGIVQPSSEITLNLEEESIEQFLIPLLREKLLSSLSLGAVIKEEKILHVSIDNDTVKGKILFLINENIAKREPIQGEE